METVTQKASPIEILRDHAENDVCFLAIMELFASRERARGQVTLNHLKETLKKKGYSFQDKDIVKALTILANLNFGKIKKNGNGSVFGLIDIRTTLQSIGNVALGKEDAVERFSPSVSYANLTPAAKPKPMPKAEAAKQEPIETFPASIQVTINGAAVYFPIPKGLTTAQISELLGEFAYHKAN